MPLAVAAVGHAGQAAGTDDNAHVCCFGEFTLKLSCVPGVSRSWPWSGWLFPSISLSNMGLLSRSLGFINALSLGLCKY